MSKGKIKYLGIIIDTVNMQLSIGNDKVDRVLTCVAELKDKRWCSRKTLEQTAGLLAHCATVVKGGRTFTRRIYNLLRDTDSSCKRLRLTDLAMADLTWWSTFLITFNGKAMMFPKDCEVVTLVTDASSSGFGGHSDWDHFYGFWKDETQACPHQARCPVDEVFYDHINVGELWPVLVGVQRQCASWRNCIVNVVTDNTQVYHALRTGRGKNYSTMGWLRELFWLTSFFNIYIRPSWICSADNVLADALSRLKNQDCVAICDHLIDGFHLCCRPGLVA